MIQMMPMASLTAEDIGVQPNAILISILPGRGQNSAQKEESSMIYLSYPGDTENDHSIPSTVPTAIR